MISKWVGESEKAIREVFKKAKQASPSIIFLDEFESIAGARTPNSGEGSDVSNRVVNQMLSSMDGVESMEGVIVIAATNRPEMVIGMHFFNPVPIMKLLELVESLLLLLYQIQ